MPLRFSLIALLLTLMTALHVHGESDDSGHLITSGDTRLYLDVAGNETGPLVLFLHGGPGNVVLGLLPFQYSVGQALEPDYLMAYLHQRGAGKSDPAPPAAQTMAANIADVSAVVEHLRKRYGKDDLHLVGHSWGGFLALQYAASAPEQVRSLTLMSSGVNVKDLSQASFEATRDWAQKNDVSEATQALAGIAEAPWRDQNQMVLAQWSSRANGGIAANLDVPAFFAAHNIPQQYPDGMQRQLAARNALYAEFVALDLTDHLEKLTMPALFLSGERDTITPPRLLAGAAQHYGGSVHVVSLPESHHLPYVDQPQEVEESLRLHFQAGDRTDQ